MGFTNKLDFLMKQRGITKAALSKEANIPYTTIDSFYKKGTDNVKLSTLLKLSTYFNCTIDYLVKDEKKGNTELIVEMFSQDNFTQQELEKICDFASFIKSKRNK